MFIYLFIICAAVGYGSAQITDAEKPSIERPCELYDLPCIRTYFASHGHCYPSGDKVKEPLFRPTSVLQLPFFNLTIIQTNIYQRGLTGSIREFYINRLTDRVVLAVDFKNLSLNSTAAFFKFHRTAQEPLTVKTDTFELYPSVTVTSVMTGANFIDILKSECHTDVQAQPAYSIGLDRSEIKDPELVTRMAVFAANIPTAAQEAFLSRGPYFIAIFMKYVICDFGYYYQ